jgi:hypothetical protein
MTAIALMRTKRSVGKQFWDGSERHRLKSAPAITQTPPSYDGKAMPPTEVLM